MEDLRDGEVLEVETCVEEAAAGAGGEGGGDEGVGFESDEDVLPSGLPSTGAGRSHTRPRTRPGRQPSLDSMLSASAWQPPPPAHPPPPGHGDAFLMTPSPALPTGRRQRGGDVVVD